MENYAGSQPACPPLRSQESNFPKKLSKTKSARFGSAAFVPLRAGQASAFRGRAGPLRAALRRGCSAGGFPAAAPGSSGLPQPPKPIPLPSVRQTLPRLAPPLKSNGGNGIFPGRLVRDTSRGTWGTRGCGLARPPPAIPIPPRGCPGRRRPAAALAKTRDEKVEGLMFSDRYK